MQNKTHQSMKPCHANMEPGESRGVMVYVPPEQLVRSESFASFCASKYDAASAGLVVRRFRKVVRWWSVTTHLKLYIMTTKYLHNDKKPVWRLCAVISDYGATKDHDTVSRQGRCWQIFAISRILPDMTRLIFLVARRRHLSRGSQYRV